MGRLQPWASTCIEPAYQPLQSCVSVKFTAQNEERSGFVVL
jgi:hypothetical protein